MASYFEEEMSDRMGNIDDAVPFFGKGFNKIYPLIMVIYTILVASNFFGRIIDFFSGWIKFKFQNEKQDMDGYDLSGVIILQKERSWLEQGHKVGELIIPLARNFYDTNEDVEYARKSLDKDNVQEEAVAVPSKEDRKGNKSEALKENSQRYGTSRETIEKKPVAMREQQDGPSSRPQLKESGSQASLLLLDEANPMKESGGTVAGPSAKGVGSTWASMKIGFQNFKAKKFLPLRKAQGTSPRADSSSESLDDIFERLKQKPRRKPSYEFDFDDDGDDILSKATR